MTSVRLHQLSRYETFMEMNGEYTDKPFREDSFIDFVLKNVPWEIPPGPLTPSSRNVKFINDPLTLVSIAVSRANGPGPKHALGIILANGDQE